LTNTVQLLKVLRFSLCYFPIAISIEVGCQVQVCFCKLSSKDYTTCSNIQRGVFDGGKPGEEAGEQ